MTSVDMGESVVEVVRAFLEKLEAERRTELLLTQGEAARRMSVSLSKLRALIRAGHIQTVRLGGTGRPMVSTEELQRAIREHTESRPKPRAPVELKRKRGRHQPYDAKAEAKQGREWLRKERRKG